MQPPPPGAWTMTGRQPAPTMPAGLPGGRAPAHASPPVPRAVGTLGDTGAPKVESVRWIRPASSVPALPLLGGFPFIW